ncbi:hypothetical protein niasHT_016502 [Heterodera trifolii]|uniref:Uncharacterized protein n=1 Tax=Heterodera trifolii TaxID=157864 RepID=A0ABD2KXG5_9BILA
MDYPMPSAKKCQIWRNCQQQSSSDSDDDDTRAIEHARRYVGVMGRGPNSHLMTNGGGPPIPQPNPSINLMTNVANSLTNLRLNPSAGGNQQQPKTDQKMHQGKKGKTANKKGVKVGSKVKLQQKLKSGVKSKKLGETKSKLGIAMFYVFMLINLFVPHVPTNVMLRFDNHSVPIEQQFVSCQPMDNGIIGQKCEFIVEQMALNKDMPNVTIWANLDGDNETIQQLGHQNISECETDGDDHSYCDTKLVISADQIDHLQKFPAGNIHKNTVIQINSTGEICPSGYVLFNYMNACNYPLMVTAASKEFPTATRRVEANQQLPVCAHAVMSSGRVWASTDCTVQDSCVVAQPPVSLFEMTFNPDGSQFMDVSYVDGISEPIGVRVSNCQSGQDQTVTFNQTAVDNLRAMFPQMAEMDTVTGQTKVKSVCGHYNTSNVCCQNEFSEPSVCGPGKSGWTPDQIQAYNAFTAISGTSYAFAFDDKRATVHCNGTTTTAVNIGFCMNP